MDIFDVNSRYACIKVNLDVLQALHLLNMLLYASSIHYFLGHLCILKHQVLIFIMTKRMKRYNKTFD